jgi:hypothetical protein
MIISVHIPKCGGTSFRLVLEGIYGDSLWLNYDAHLGQSRDQIQLIPRGTRCIHGHFLANTFGELVPQPQLVTWLRHPVERVVSNYYHYLRSPDPRDACCRELFEKNLSLEQFAELDWMRNEATRYMAGTAMDAFAFIGITERFNESVHVFGSMFGVSVPAESPRVNVNPKRLSESYVLSPRTYEHILSLNLRDLICYDMANRALDRQLLTCLDRLIKWSE